MRELGAEAVGALGKRKGPILGSPAQDGRQLEEIADEDDLHAAEGHLLSLMWRQT